jgi:L-lactate dehydrogenase complex protein LldG
MPMPANPSSLSSRDEVLRRIRAAIGDTPTGAAAIAAEWAALPREYKQAESMGRDAVLDMLEDRLRDYDAQVVRAKSGELGAVIARMLTERGKRRLVVPIGLPEALGSPLPDGFEFVADQGFAAAELDAFEGVVTASTVAIAETGTIVLQTVPGQGRRAATLVPDYHLCVVRSTDVVETVPEATARLHSTATLATTFVSGPSATADIEMTRIKGVHGPRFLDVILVS